MKYPPNNYVEAFYDLLKTASSVEKNQITLNFLRLLKKTGDIKHSKKILEALDRKFINEKGGKWVDIEIARELPETKTRMLKNEFSEKDHVGFKINSELVAGTRVTVNGEEELDNSLIKKLKKIF